MQKYRRSLSKRSGFTVIEILVSIIILIVLGLMASSVLQRTAAILGDGNKRADNFALARLSLNLMNQDLGLAVLRSDLTRFPDHSNGGSRLAFWAERRGVETAATPIRFGERRLSAIEYVLDTTNPDVSKLGLYRGSSALLVSDTLPLNPAFPMSQPADTSHPQYVMIGPGVIDFQIQFQRRDGSMAGQYYYDSNDPRAAANTLGAVVSLAVVDARSHEQLIRSSMLSKLADWLRNTANSNPGNVSHAKHWMDKSSSASDTQLPPLAKQSVRFYDRLILISAYRD